MLPFCFLDIELKGNHQQNIEQSWGLRALNKNAGALALFCWIEFDALILCVSIRNHPVGWVIQQIVYKTLFN
jgi:hypothetical protein